MRQGILKMEEEKPAKWQFLTLLDYVDTMPMEEVDWLLGNYGDASRLIWWTATHSRMEAALERIEEAEIEAASNNDKKVI
jgi:hypothetical protein